MLKSLQSTKKKDSYGSNNYRVDTTKAVWNGDRFMVDCDSYDFKVTMG